MPEDRALPFHSFSFTLIADRKPRVAFRMTSAGEGLYELHVEKGSASNPTSQFTRLVPVDVAQRFKDALQEIGVFGWEESYGDSTAPGSRRWTVNTVFKEGVFAVSSKGGSDVPAGFDAMLAELYQLDFPRPDAGRPSSVQNAQSMGSLSPAALRDMMGAGELSEMMSQLQQNPQVLQERMKEEYRRMSPDERRQLIDMLVASGMGDRGFWEDFFGE